MSTTTMHFGPEWMRTRQNPAPKAQSPPSSPSTYSSLVSSVQPVLFERRDDPNPFRYSKEEMLRIYKEGNVKSELGLEVERWVGVVREVPSEPVGLREMGEAEKKLFSGSLNSDLRRRQSGDYLTPLSTSTDRSRLNYSNPNTNSPLRERFGPLRRRDSTADSPTGVSLPRKQSFSSLQTPGIPPRDVGLPSPRSRVGLTSNFDGVLNSSGESWGARRRASEASLKSAVAMSREASGDFQNEVKANEIREEMEELGTGLVGKSHRGQLREYPAQAEDGLPQASGPAGQENAHDADPDANHPSRNTVDYNRLSLGHLLPSLQDLASVEWSYKDPTGPFRADLMQKWYDEGYFSPDLPMKRTHLDSHWTTVEELARRAGGDKIFLSPIHPTAPPGLPRRNDPVLQPYPASMEYNIYPGLNQPSPIRTLRSSTLDNYVASVSNSSDSPSGTRYGGGSPDSCGPGGKASNPPYFSESSMNGRIANFVNIPDTSAPFPARRATYGDSLDPVLMRSPGYLSIVPSRTASIGDYALNGVYNSLSYPQAFDPTHGHTVEPVSLGAYNQSPVVEQGLDYRNHDGSFRDGAFGSAALGQQNFGSTNIDQRLEVVNEDTSALNQLSNFTSAINTAGPAQTLFNHAESPLLSHPNTQLPTNGLGVLDQGAIVHSSLDAQKSRVNHPESLGRPAWQEIGDTTRRSGALDTVHHRGPSTAVSSTTAPRVAPWSNVLASQQLPHPQEVPPWSYPLPITGEVKDEARHDRLTFSNVVQHNQQYQSVDGQDSRASALDSSTQQAEHVNVAATSPVETSAAPIDPPSPPLVKATAQFLQDRKPVTLATPETSEKVDTPPQAPPPKTAWAKDDDSKKPVSAISLREIQEAEAKKTEVRKATERVMKPATSTSPETKDEVQPFTASWGLPSSQAGARLPAPSKEVNTAPNLSSSSPTPPVPVWTSAVKAAAAKKSMKEIQEEEERRKKLTATKESSGVTTRKGPAEQIHKAPATQPTAWTVVGHNGKPATPAVVSTKPSSATGSAVQTSSAARANGTTATKAPAPPIVAARPAASATPKITDDFPPAPSHDFLRWLTESLKGLNNAVNVEEIMSMLLSFPLNPDPSTIELISDLIYANSTTLDGRRFATEFVGRRKNDATSSRAKSPGASGKSAAKPVSIADVVKAAPKPTQSEWAFKVVNKKKKGGKT